MPNCRFGEPSKLHPAKWLVNGEELSTAVQVESAHLATDSSSELYHGISVELDPCNTDKVIKGLQGYRRNCVPNTMNKCQIAWLPPPNQSVYFVHSAVMRHSGTWNM